ncbi:MAG: LamG-like jellyroll fold domain-containing protein [bacterium]|nr:LamG-like jellyroll fold domain-containing protein [bacterium]
MKQSVQRQAGFSLIELLVVITVLGALVGVMISVLNIAGTIYKGKVVKAKSFQRKIETNLSLSAVGSWNFNDSASPVRDTSGNGNNGNFNAAALESDCIGLGFNSCLKVSGTVNQYVNVPDSPTLRVGTYTVSVWIRPNGVPSETWKGIVGKPGRSFNIWLNQSGYIHHRFHTDLSTNAGSPDTPSKSITWNEWNFIVITNDGAIAKTYINGDQKASGAVSGVLLADATTLYIGRNLDGGSSNYFDGLIDEVTIYNQAITAYQVHQLYLDGVSRHLLAMVEGRKQTGEKTN